MKIADIAENVRDLLDKSVGLDEELYLASHLLIKHIQTMEAGIEAVVPMTHDQFKAIQLMRKRYETMLDMMSADQPRLEAEIDVEITKREIMLVPRGRLPH